MSASWLHQAVCSGVLFGHALGKCVETPAVENELDGALAEVDGTEEDHRAQGGVDSPSPKPDLIANH